MGLDIDKIFGSLKNSVNQGMNDVLKTGGNVALGYLEGQAIGVLEADKKQHDGQFQDATMQLLQRPSSTDSLGAYMQNLLQAPLTKQYGQYALLFLAIVVGGSILVGKRVKI